MATVNTPTVGKGFIANSMYEYINGAVDLLSHLDPSEKVHPGIFTRAKWHLVRAEKYGNQMPFYDSGCVLALDLAIALDSLTPEGCYFGLSSTVQNKYGYFEGEGTDTTHVLTFDVKTPEFLIHH